MKRPDTVTTARRSATLGWGCACLADVTALLSTPDGPTSTLLLITALITCFQFFTNLLLWLAADRP